MAGHTQRVRVSRNRVKEGEGLIVNPKRDFSFYEHREFCKNKYFCKGFGRKFEIFRKELNISSQLHASDFKLRVNNWILRRVTKQLKIYFISRRVFSLSSCGNIETKSSNNTFI